MASRELVVIITNGERLYALLGNFCIEQSFADTPFRGGNHTLMRDKIVMRQNNVKVVSNIFKCVDFFAHSAIIMLTKRFGYVRGSILK